VEECQALKWSWPSFSCEWKGCDGAVQSVRRLGSSRLLKGVCCWCSVSDFLGGSQFEFCSWTLQHCNLSTTSLYWFPCGNLCVCWL
jgi:hypothetical protein